MRIISLILLSLIIVSCEDQQSSVPEIIINPTDSIKKDTVKVKTETIDTTITTVNVPQDLKDQIEKQVNEVSVKIQNPDYTLKPSSYKVKRPEQVGELLALIYERKIEILKREGVANSINSEFQNFFTLQYCDDDILRELDQLCEQHNKFLSTKVSINFDNAMSGKKNKITVKK